MYLLFALFAVLQAGDWLTTRRILANGGYEKNALVGWLMARFGVDGGLAVKTAAALALGFVLTRLPIPLLAVLSAWYVYVVWSNWRVLRQQKQRRETLIPEE